MFFMVSELVNLKQSKASMATLKNVLSIQAFHQCSSLVSQTEYVQSPFVVLDSSLAAAVAMAPFDSGFDPRQRRHLIRAQLVSQLIRVQLVLLD